MKIPIIHPNWIEESLKAKTLLPYDKFKLPIFMGCIICAEGLSEEETSKINGIVTDEGGEFSTIYTRGFTTHYITTPELMAKKNKESNSSSIDCLSSKWIYDSLEKQYPLPIHSYLLTKQEENETIKLSQSINNTISKNETENNLSSFDHCILSSYGSTSFNQNIEMLCRKICIIYYPDISPIINYLIIEDSLIDYPPHKDDIIDKNSITCLKLSWLLECIEKKHFIMPNQSHIWIPKKTSINLSKSNSVSSSFSNANTSSSNSSISIKSNLFQGKRICLIFFEKNDVLKNNIRKIIESNNGTIVNSMQISNYIICGKAIDMEQPTTIPLLTDVRTVTYKWLEKCLKENKIINRKDDSLYYPHPNLFRDLKMSISQYTGIQREYIKSIISALGGKCEETFNSSHNYLICFQPNGEKYVKATEWKIPCITGQWACQCAAKDQILPIDSFVVKPKTVNDVLKRNNESQEKSTPNRKRRKTKK